MLRVWARSFFLQILHPNVIGTQGSRRQSETRLLCKHVDLSSHPALTLGKADIMVYTYNLSVREVEQEQSQSSELASPATRYSELKGVEPSASSQLHSQPAQSLSTVSFMFSKRSWLNKWGRKEFQKWPDINIRLSHTCKHMHVSLLHMNICITWQHNTWI